MFSSVRTVFVDKCVREQADKLKEADALDSGVVDVCGYVFTGGGPPVELGTGVMTLGGTLYSDVGVHPALMEVLDSTSTAGGRACLRAILNAPTSDPDTLAARQDVLVRLAAVLSSPADLETATRALASMKGTEQDVAWALRHPHQDAETQALYDMAFFKIWPLRRLNDVPVALTALNLHRIVVSPLVGLLSPLVYFVIPYFVLRFRVGLKVSLVQYLHLMRASMTAASSLYSPSVQWISLGFSLLFYFQGVFSSIEMASTLSCVCSSIVRRSNMISAFKSSALDLLRVCAPLGEGVVSFLPRSTKPGDRASKDATANVSGFNLQRANFGRHLSTFKRLDLDKCVQLMQDAYAVDALVAIVTAKTRLNACDVRFVKSPSPVFDAIGLRHPCIPIERAVPNDILMQSDTSCSALLTGPNAGGKSTLLKSMLLATLMAQTLTIACCTSLSITPYSHMHSHINVPDVQGSMSLFEAEMDRARESMDVLSRMPADRFSILIMDEVFSSTNPIEGIAGAFSVAKNLAASPNVTLVVSTHFLYLKKLATLRNQQARPLFQLVQMPVQMSSPPSSPAFTYPYRVQEGVCEQLIALELLKGSGFSEQVIQDALEVKRNLLGDPGRRSRKPARCLPLTARIVVQTQGRPRRRQAGSPLRRRQ